MQKIFTILSAFSFIICLLIDEFIDVRFHLVILIITSLLYKYGYFYINSEWKITPLEKIDQLVILCLTMTTLQIPFFYYMIGIICTIVKFELFHLISFCCWIYVTINMFFTDFFIFFVHIISSTCSVMSYINFRYTNSWTLLNSWAWHLSVVTWFTCVAITKYYSHDSFIETHAKDKLPYLLKLSKMSSYT